MFFNFIFKVYFKIGKNILTRKNKDREDWKQNKKKYFDNFVIFK